MELYFLEVGCSNDGEYEDYEHYERFYGIFSTIEKAKEYAEKLMEDIREGTRYRDTFEVSKDWYEFKKDIFKKEVFYGEGYADEWSAIYRISKVIVDPEYKED